MVSRCCSRAPDQRALSDRTLHDKYSHMMDALRYAVQATRELEFFGGHLEVVVSPCEPFRIGSVQFGHGPRGERPEIVFSATLEDRAAAVHELPTDDVPAGYSSQGSGAELGSDAVVWQLRAADDTNFLPSPFHFDARGVATGSVLRGDGARVSMDAWRPC